MRRPFLILCFVITSFYSFGQSVRFGIKAGLNLSDQTINSLGMPVKSSNISGFHAGAIFDFEIANISIQPGVFYSQKGYQYNQALSDGSQTVQKPIVGKIQLNYLEVPLNLVYKIKIIPDLRFYLGGGGYAGYGLSGSYILSGQRTDVYFTKSIQGYQYKNPDYGVNFIAGVEILKKIVVDANYSLGLNDLSYYPASTIKNKSIGVSVGYLF
ncbi:MAG TPA: porin family protein [Mucilaginibacter sp.]|jgi:hypothetical protein|nr:porin family protein [Mucilaginibacter sp.]